jgi:hypothetical protein
MKTNKQRFDQVVQAMTIQLVPSESLQKKLERQSRQSP